MKRKLLSKRGISALVTLLLSVIWTVAAGVADVSAIGPMGSSVGLSTLNAAVRDLVGVRMELYELTDILGLVPIGKIDIGRSLNKCFYCFDHISKRNKINVIFSKLSAGRCTVVSRYRLVY